MSDKVVMAPTIGVLVVHSPGARRIEQHALTLPTGSTVAQAVTAAGLADALASCQAGIGGRKAVLGELLREGDRVELLRPLQVDPKHARRARFGQQGAGTVGLFARRRPGAKSGY